MIFGTKGSPTRYAKLSIPLKLLGASKDHRSSIVPSIPIDFLRKLDVSAVVGARLSL